MCTWWDIRGHLSKPQSGVQGAENKLSWVIGDDHCSPASAFLPLFPHCSPSSIPSILTKSLMPSGVPVVQGFEMKLMDKTEKK